MENIGDMVAQFLDSNESLPPTGQYGQDTGQQAAQPQEGMTIMRSCSATSCCNICTNGQCSLEVVDINEHGGCAMYEAAADSEAVGDEEMPDTGRYDETPQSNSNIISQISQIAQSMF